MRRLTDTSPDAQRVLDAIHRDMPASRKWTLLDQLYRFGRSLHAAGVADRAPGSTPAQIRDDWVATHFGRIPRRFATEGLPMENRVEFREAVEGLIQILDGLGIPYALGGSLASSIHGVNRNTIDADLAVEPFPGLEEPFVAALGPEYYVSLDAVRRAVSERTGFNVIQTTTGFKADLFVRKDRPFELCLMKRREAFVPSGTGARPIQVVSAEDVILLKLEWYRPGDEVSERQWSDVVNVLRVQGVRLDAGYLDHWAVELGVADLLARAREEAILV